MWLVILSAAKPAKKPKRIVEELKTREKETQETDRERLWSVCTWLTKDENADIKM